MKKIIAGKECEVTEEGFLVNSGDWSMDVARAIALELAIHELTDTHLAVIAWLREQDEAGVSMTLRKVGNSGVTDIKTFYTLFPGKPLKYASKIAGLPKPVSCI